MDVFWIEAVPWNPANDAQVTVRACSADLSLVVYQSNLEWIPVVAAGPTFATEVFNGAFVGNVNTMRGDIPLITGAGEIDTWAGYHWAGRAVLIWTATLASANGALSYSAPVTLIFDGLVESFDPDGALMALTAKRPDGKIANAVYAGTGGANGSAAVKNHVKPFAAGTHRNRPAKLIDAGKLLFQVHGYGAINAIARVREGGNPLDQAFVYHASAALLIAATVPATQIHVCLATGMFRLGFTPMADISADFTGYTRDGFKSTLADVVMELLFHTGWDTANKVDYPSFATVNAKHPHPIQYHDETGEGVLEAITALLAPAGCYWDVDNLGIFYIGVLSVDGAAADYVVGDEGLGDFDILEIDHFPTRPPFWRTRVGYEQNPSVMSFGDTQVGATAEQLTLINNLASDLDDKIDVYFQNGEPIGLEGDLWFDTGNGFWYRREGNAWVLTQDAGIGEALLAAGGAQATADGKITTYFSDATPVTYFIGDLWVKPSEIPRTVRRWSGTLWEVVSTRGADANGGIVDSGTGGATVYVNRSNILTNLGVAAGIANQGAFATDSRDPSYVFGTFPNLLYNGGLKLRLDGLSGSSSWLWTEGAQEGQYTYLQTLGAHTLQSEPFPVYASTGYTLAADVFNNSSGTLSVDIQYFKDAAGLVPTDTGHEGPQVDGTGGEWTAKRSFGFTPAGAIRARFRIFTTNHPGGGATMAARRIKFSQGDNQSPFSDEKTYGALYRDGTTIEALKPIEFGSDVTSTINGIADIVVEFDAAGTAKPGQLPKNAIFRLFRNGAEITSGVTWAWTLTTGSATATLVYADGVSGALRFQLDALPTNSKGRITATYGALVRVFDVTLARKQDVATGGGSGSGGGSTSSITVFGTVTETTYPSSSTPTGGPMTLKAGATGKIDVTVGISYERFGTGIGSTALIGKVQWRPIGGSWTDAGAEVTSANAAITYQNYDQGTGSLGFSRSITGLVDGTDYQVQFLGRGSNGVSLELYGTINGIGA